MSFVRLIAREFLGVIRDAVGFLAIEVIVALVIAALALLWILARFQ